MLIPVNPAYDHRLAAQEGSVVRHSHITCPTISPDLAFRGSSTWIQAPVNHQESLAMDFAKAVNEEALELEAAGADIIQLDEPWLRNDPEAASRYAVAAINRALQGLKVPTVVHLCFGYAAVVTGKKPSGYSFLPGLSDSIAKQISIEAAQPKLDLGVLRDLAGKKVMLGVLDLSEHRIETPELVAERIRSGLRYVRAEDLIPAPDCGMKYLPRNVAFGKLKSLAEGAAIVRRELSS